MTTEVKPENRIATNGALTPAKPIRVVQDESPIAYIMDTARFEHTQRISGMMARCAFMPDHLIKDSSKNHLPPERAIANCMLVLSQSMRWQMDPYSVAPETYVVGGKLSYQGKLIAAVVNARGGLHRSLDVIYSNGKGDDLAAVVFASKEPIPPGAKDHLKKYANNEDRDSLTELKFLGVMAIRVSVGQCKTNNQMWTKDPEQKLFYTGATKWARRFRPELMLGVITDDDFERMSATQHSEPPANETPRTLDDLNKAVESVATVTVTDEQTAEPQVKQVEAEVVTSEAQPSPGEVPEWVLTWENRINMAPKFSPATADFDALLKEFKAAGDDIKEQYYGLFSTWTDKAIVLADKPSMAPLLRSKIEQLTPYVPGDLIEHLSAKLDDAGK